MSNQETSKRAAAQMAEALARMADKYPFHAEWLSCDRWREQPGIITMAVTVRDGCVRFHYDAAFVGDCSPEELEGVIHHELNHLVFGHPYTDPRQYPNRNARVIAEEVTVNEVIREPLPGSPVTLADFPELPPNEDTHTRYERLKDRNDLADRVRLLDAHSLWHDDAAGDAWVMDMLAVDKTLRHPEPGHDPFPSDFFRWGWHRPPGVTRARAKAEKLRDIGKPPQPLNWRRILADMPMPRMRLDPTYHRPPRRFPQWVGVFPGHTCRREKPRAMAVVDTSGSMKGAQLERVQAELNRLRELADVTLVQCDTEIRDIRPLAGNFDEVTGRGGTNLRPPFEADVLAKVRPDFVIYFTDGEGETPDSPPAMPVIWCLTPKGKRPAAWGRVLEMQT